MCVRAPLLLLAAGILNTHPSGTLAALQHTTARECESQACFTSAIRIQDLVDESVDPCDDFYQFACGGWINRTSIPGSQSSWDQFLILRDQLLYNMRDLLDRGDKEDDAKPIRQARALYSMCLDTDKLEQLGIKPLLDAMKKLGISPTPPKRRQFTGRKFDWVYAVARAQRLLALNVLFKFWVGRDIRNSSRNVMMVDQGSYSLNLDYLMERNRFHKELGAHWRYIRDMVDAFEAANKCPDDTASKCRDDASHHVTPTKVSLGESFAQDILNFSMQLSRIVRSREARRNSGPTFHEMTISQAQQLMQVGLQGENIQMNWTWYLENMFANTDMVLKEDSDVILAMEPKYLQKLSVLIARTRATTLERFLWWNVFASLAPLTLQRFRELSFRLNSEVYGVMEKTPRPVDVTSLGKMLGVAARAAPTFPPMDGAPGGYGIRGDTVLDSLLFAPKSYLLRWKTCARDVNTHFGMAVSRLYVQKHFHDKSKTKALEMVEHIRNAFTDHVWELPWMDDETKRTAVEKAHAMRTFIGYPDWLTSNAELEQYYTQTEIVNGEFFESILKLAGTSVETSLKEIRTTPKSDRWVMPASTVNAFYSPLMNSMTFPAGILQPPFYNLGLTSLNYGAIGSIMGHELTHGFDDQGRRFDKHGNMRQWWTENTLREYKNRVSCFVKQYSSYRIPELGDKFFVNGITTQGENIADNGGLHQALWAFRTLQAHHSVGAQTSLPGFAARYTPDQLFFLGFAHMWCGKSTAGAMRSRLVEGVHSPNKYRVIGTLSNSVEFSEAWGCHPGSTMNPAKKCVLW